MTNSGRHVAPLTPRTQVVLARRVAGRRKPPGPSAVHVVVIVMLAAIVGLGALSGLGAAVGSSVISSLAAELPNPANLENLTFAQPTIIYDRTGTVELAQFGNEDRQVVGYATIPHLVIDATTTAEDRTFWTNQGFDPAAIVAAAFQNASGNSQERGASTITQQLVRARLLPASVMTSGDRYTRKALEIIQSARLTAAFPGEAGKERIITAYLNDIFYGHQAYGIAAAAKIYFGIDDLSKLSVAQAALLAGLPQAPSTYDPYLFAKPDAKGRLVVPSDASVVVRRDYILRELAAHPGRWTSLSTAQLQAALAEPVVLAGVPPQRMKAPQFVWAVRAQLEQMLGGSDAVDTGGYKVITTLDWNAQQLAEKYLYAAAIIPNIPKAQARQAIAALGIRKGDQTWVNALRGKDVHDGALVALDYRTGDVLAYAGSAAYYRTDLTSTKFSPEFDAAAAWRQPGSAWKAVLYASAFQQRVLDPGSLLLDISTNFGGGWAPKDADTLERGPVLVRQAIQQSLNLPAIRALQRVGNGPVADIAQKLGITFENGKDSFMQAGLAGAIGTVEVRPIDLTTAFGGLANGGVHVPTQMLLSITGPNGADVYTAPTPKGTAAIDPQSAFLIDDVLAGNTDPRQNRFWAATLALYNGPKGTRRPAAAKTGTADDRRDFSTYGFLPPPADPAAPGLAVGVWMGNSDHSAPNARVPATSLTTAGEVWHAFIRDYTAKWPVASFTPPAGVVKATLDRWSGGKPGPWTRATTTDWFIQGTQPGAPHAIDRPGLLYTSTCGSWEVDPVQAELGPAGWKTDVADWVRRAAKGVGELGKYGSRTAYYFGATTWGGPLDTGTCSAGGGSGRGGGGGGGGHHHHHGGGTTQQAPIVPFGIPLLLALPWRRRPGQPSRPRRLLRRAGA